MSSTTAPTDPAAPAPAASVAMPPSVLDGVPWPDSPDGGCGVSPPAVPLPDVAPDVGATGHGHGASVAAELADGRLSYSQTIQIA